MLDPFSSSTSYSVVAPFAADIETTVTGTVWYSHTFFADDFWLGLVNDYITAQTGSFFQGTWMLVAEWNGVVSLTGSLVSNS